MILPIAETKQKIATTILNFEGINLLKQDIAHLLVTKKINLMLDDVDQRIINNLFNTFDFIENLDLDRLDINLELYKRLNKKLTFEQALWPGELRTQTAYIKSICEDIPPCQLEFLKQELLKLNNIEKKHYKEVIINCFMALIRSQPFYDGNKRSTLLLCNLALYKHHLGYFFIPDSQYKEFDHKLTLFYRDNNKSPLYEMLLQECFHVN